jgi:DICT domain-containing protein
MTTFTLKLDTSSKAAKMFLEFMKTLSFVQLEEQNEKEKYDPEFVKKIQKARKEKGGKTVTAENLWELIK